MLAKKLRGDLLIHCFEPLPRHLQYLRENIALNRFDCNDFHLHSFAISVEPGAALFVDHSYGSSLVSDEQPFGTKGKSKLLRLRNVVKTLLGRQTPRHHFSVPTLPLSKIFGVIGGEKIDLLQMDIQGFEDPVLGAYLADGDTRRGRIMQFLVGTHGPEIHERCKSHLENAGFGILRDDYETKHQPDGILLGELVPEAKHPISTKAQPPGTE